MANYELTPKGVLSGFVAIEKPSTKFNEDGVFSFQMDFTGEEAKEMKKRIDGYMAASKMVGKASKLASPPYTIDGKTLTVKFKTKAIIRKRNGEEYHKTIRLFDADAKELTEPCNLGAGSTVIVAYDTYMWNVSSSGAGVSLPPAMVQITELVESNFGGGGGNPFGKVEGFVAPKASPFEVDVKEDVVVEDDIDF